MTVPITPTSVVSESHLQSLQSRAARGADEPQAFMQREIESMFASILIKTMRQTLDGEGLFPGDKSDALGSLFDQFMGAQMSQGGGIGMSRVLSAYAGNAKLESST